MTYLEIALIWLAVSVVLCPVIGMFLGNCFELPNIDERHVHDPRYFEWRGDGQVSEGAKKRQAADCMRAAKLAALGWTHREIAAVIGKRPEQIKAIVLKGERLLQVEAER